MWETWEWNKMKASFPSDSVQMIVPTPSPSRASSAWRCRRKRGLW